MEYVFIAVVVAEMIVIYVMGTKAERNKKKRIKSKSTHELNMKYNEIAKEIARHIQTAKVFGATAYDNKKLEQLRSEGRMIETELKARGCKVDSSLLSKVDSSLLNGYATNGRSKGRSKNASVIGRAAAGAIIAGPAGAVVGALSAVDKNNKRK